MKCELSKRQTDKFKIIIGDIKMKYPIFPIVSHCPNWKKEIMYDFKLILNEELSSDINGVKNFFDGLLNDSVDITIDNCKTILKLATFSGNNEIIENATTIVNESQRSIPDVISEFQEKCKTNEDVHHIEVYLAKHYNEMLKFPHLIKNIEVPQHLKILQLAIQHYGRENFDFHGFINFIIELFENNCDKKYSLNYLCKYDIILLSLFDPFDFEIEEIERLSNCQSVDFSYMKFKCSNFISSIKQNKQQIAEQNEQIKQIKAIQDQNQNQFNEIKNLIINQQNLFNQFQDQTNSIITNQISNLIKTNNQNIINNMNEMKSNIQLYKEQKYNHFSELKHIIDDLKIQVQSNKEKTENLENMMQIKIQKPIIDEITIVKNNINNIKNDIIKEIQTCNEQNKNQFTNNEKLIYDIKQQNSNNLNEIQLVKKRLEENQQTIEEKRKTDKTEEISRNNSQTQKIDDIKSELKIIKEKIEDYYLHNKLILRQEYNGDSFSGILSTLTRTHGCNLNDNGFISISGNNSCNWGSFSSLIDYKYTGQSYRSGGQNSYICFDFKNYCILVSAYSIRSSTDSNPCNPRSWTLEGSNNESEWSVIDSHQNDSTISVRDTAYLFKINEENHIKYPFRFIRFKLTGPCSCSHYHIEITNFEFFGKLFQK